MTRALHLCQALLFTVLFTSHAHAGRPLTTDDAGTAPAKTCQVESWVERPRHGDAAWFVAPACGVVDGVELGLGYVRLPSSDASSSSAEIAMKWVAPSWTAESPWGQWHWGLKLASSTSHVREESHWQSAEATVAGLVSLEISEQWAVHTNVGYARDKANRTSATLANMAVTWAPVEDWLLFAEIQTDNRTDRTYHSHKSVGVRKWVIPEQLGLDVTAKRSSANELTWSFGLGWYGLFD